MKVSVIIPARNEEKYIRDSLISLKNQTFRDLEIIVVADSCTDKTVELSKKYADKILITQNKSTAKSRNSGAKIAQGDILIFLDADTRLSENFVSSVVSLPSKNFYGTSCVKPNHKNIKSLIHTNFKNFVHKFKIYKGSTAVLFCTSNLFKKINGFENNCPFERLSFSKKAKKYAPYFYLNSCYAVTSMRRFEKLGYLFVMKYYIKNYIFFKFGKTLDSYKIIR